ncbi:tetratricopeptide (TPR) repeat protein [Agrobacterium vitis]|nr:tetratricopeptide (TPR) repeat protein [Agrobacterium vitis]MBE1436561.1 tetratricopeptide (TPR) repeat protein [Agrobacterium vitis]
MTFLSKFNFLGLGAKRPAYLDALERADKARDHKDWAAAIREYTDYLQAKPEDAAIWIQLGHGLKEIKNYDEAGIAYQKAYAINPVDDDLMLQIGHLEKIKGHKSLALEWYERSVSLNANNRHAVDEVAALRAEFLRDATPPEVSGDHAVIAAAATEHVTPPERELLQKPTSHSAMKSHEVGVLSRHIPFYTKDILTVSQSDASKTIHRIVEELEVVR